MILSLEINTLADAELAGRQLRVLLNAFGSSDEAVALKSSPVILTPKQRRGRPPKPKDAGKPLTKPDEEEQQPAEQLDLIDLVEALPAPDPLVAEPESAEPVDPREQLRDIARSLGVTWLRGVLAERDVTSLGALSDGQVEELLREFA